MNTNQISAYMAEGEGFAQLLVHMMQEQGVQGITLCEGICTPAMLTRICQGERIPDKMTRDRLLERLGISDERNENLLCHEDYVKWSLRQNIVECVENREITGARELLAQYAASEDFEGKLEQQFYAVMEIQLQQYENVSKEELGKRLERALKLTVPAIDEKKVCELQLALKELNLVLEYAKCVCFEHLEERCLEILEYIERSFMDENSKAQIYPKVVWYLGERMLKKDAAELGKLLGYVEQAIEYLRNTQKAHYVWEMLVLRKKLLEREENQEFAGQEKANAERRQRLQETGEWKAVFEKLYEMTGIEPITKSYAYMYRQQKIYDINEVMRRRRSMEGISRKKLGAGEVSEKTLIRMEKENTKTQWAVVRYLFHRLHLSGELHRVDIVVDRREALELLEELVRYANNFDLENERKCMSELEKYLDMNIPLNRQFIKKEEAILLYGTDKNKNREQAINLMREALEYTISWEKVKKSERLYLTGGEIGCIHNMAAYTGNKAMTEYHEVLWKLCQSYEEEGEVEAHISGYTWILTTIAKVYSNMRLHEQAIEIARKAISAGLRCGRLAFVNQNLYCLRWNMGQLYRKEKLNEDYSALKGLKMDMVLSRFCKDSHNEKIYERAYGIGK